MKVTVLGAAGGIGQSLALLLKVELPAFTDLALYDIAPVTPGVAVDISHIPTSVKVKGYCGEDPSEALAGADLVMISAGIARKPGMTRADLFNINAGIVRDLVAKAAKYAPNACIGIITNPVNTLVAVAAEELKKAGVYDKRKLFGVTTLDVIRAKTFVAELKGLDVSKVKVPVIGGHSGPTILPLLSQAYFENKKIEFSQAEIDSLTHRIKNAGTEVVEAKAGAGSATMSMAESGARFATAVIKALAGEDIVRYAYVEGDENDGYPRFFARPVRFGRNGIEAFLPVGTLSDYEQKLLDESLPILHEDIALGEQFVREG
ncbi:malate dehydrogenase [Haemophilus paracuniculus]|uniref:Malate dehydrogenase n=1 Tax=Haemophilus paracuniculus TaxID=734 RepID=A0A1T0AQL3_9PAST|nr:malate dehydrogenase [Haemophilus paracuniculus]OOR98475.1 malate dehydrogenase [Haemophilus paracuniculus]